MRLLHVSDLNLGRALGDLSREPEQRDLVGELIAAADELEVALTLISGDVFDGWSPPAWAEDLFFELLDGLAAVGQRALAVIAGNHDAGLRLAAADPLARRLGIVLAGDVGEPCLGFDGGRDRVQVTPLAAQVARIAVPGAEAPIIAGLLPFLSEARVARDGGRARARPRRARGAPVEAHAAARAGPPIVRDRGGDRSRAPRRRGPVRDLRPHRLRQIDDPRRHLPRGIEERTGDEWTPIDTGGRKPEDYLSEQIVRISMSDFQQAVVLPQGELDALLRARPAERRTLVASLFRTEHLGQPLFDALRALSERIQLAGRARFDFFFLAEGFGGLDAVTLDAAVSAPERLRGPHRVTGMITHLDAIEERVPRKLRVQPGHAGATASVHLELGEHARDPGRSSALSYRRAPEASGDPGNQ